MSRTGQVAYHLASAAKLVFEGLRIGRTKYFRATDALLAFLIDLLGQVKRRLDPPVQSQPPFIGDRRNDPPSSAR